MKQSKEAEEIAQRCCREFEELVGDRGTFENQWQEVAERALPGFSRTFSPHSTRTPGEKHTDKMFDSTASQALEQFVAVMASMLTPSAQMWHRVTATNPAIRESRSVQEYFEEVTRRLFAYRYSPRSGFVTQTQATYRSMGAFGNGPLFADPLEGEPGIRYRAIPIGEIYLTENHQHVVDGAYRYFKLTARQAVQRWGDMLSDTIVTAATSKPETKFAFLHVVRPRVDRDPERVDFKGMPYASWYICVDDKCLMSEGGYRVFPFPVCRYTTAPDEIYARGPLMQVLPAIKMLNEMAKTHIKQGHRIVDPPIMAPAEDGAMGAFSLKPGAINYGFVSPDGRMLAQPMPTGSLADSEKMMETQRTVIKDACLVTLFQILVENPQMTATEVIERSREKGILLAPVVDGLQATFLGPLIEREIDILSQQGLLPDMPPELIEAEGEYGVQYDSPLSRMQRAEEVAGAERQVQEMLLISREAQMPELLDIIDFDTMNREKAEIRGMPVRWLASEEAVEAARAQRAEAAEQQQAIASAPGAAAMLKAGAVASEKVGVDPEA